jgi:hypothetical protein
VTVNNIRATIRLVERHRSLAAKTAAAFPRNVELEPLGYINLRRFGVQVPAHLTANGTRVEMTRIWFDTKESANIASELHKVRRGLAQTIITANQDTARATTLDEARAATERASDAHETASAARRLLIRYRLAPLLNIEAVAWQWSTQRVLNMWETEALRIALLAAAATSEARADQLEADFNHGARTLTKDAA